MYRIILIYFKPFIGSLIKASSTRRQRNSVEDETIAGHFGFVVEENSDREII